MINATREEANMDFHDMAVKRMLDSICNATPIYGCYIESNKVSDDEDDDRKVIDYEVMSSICKSMKANQMKLLHKRIIDIADELYRFSDELDMSDKEEIKCKISIIEALKELNNVAEYLSKHTLSGE
jgi:hypothetical protein